eukprot:CAMPEP_0174713082 /NCGR_PEP_ID=MMETSP1094-20130205/13873_1 /TAXON_ID=156173 /ORGANISM="Chrysochromulina brevifilum, Strain UTEX LB 985" /LENGTH=138 /DNA_ID=CAMNT_0015912229 /DNA_START=303 /DNA_END=718 /DNA_ORIENTATION=-
MSHLIVSGALADPQPHAPRARVGGDLLRRGQDGVRLERLPRRQDIAVDILCGGGIGESTTAKESLGPPILQGVVRHHCKAAAGADDLAAASRTDSSSAISWFTSMRSAWKTRAARLVTSLGSRFDPAVASRDASWLVV